MTFTRSESCIKFNYQLAGSDLQSVSSTKDLGVIFNSDFSFKCHIYLALKSSITATNRNFIDINNNIYENLGVNICKAFVGFHAPTVRL